MVMVDKGSDADALANVKALSPFETLPAKEARDRKVCRGKLLDCCNKIYEGLQCGLSGNPAMLSVTKQRKV